MNGFQSWIYAIGLYNIDYKSDVRDSYSDIPIYTKYKRLTDDFLIEIAHDFNSIQRDENGKINRVYFYNDASNPVNQSKDKKELWDNYFERLKRLSKLEKDR